MAFPATYNIQYYKGDTLEFRVYPKDSSGGIFDLSSFSSPTFTVATTRGVPGIPSQITCFAEKSLDNTHLVCTIRAGDGSQLNAGTQYVYDIQISKGPITSPYNKVFTLLTGNINVTEQVTGAGTIPVEPGVPVPQPVSDFQLTSTTTNSITVSWTASPSAGTALGQTVFLNANISDPENPATLFTENIPASATSYTYTNLFPDTNYAIGIVVFNQAGTSSIVGTIAKTSEES